MTVDAGLRPLFRQRIPPPIHFQSVETGGTGLGVPDTNYCIPSSKPALTGLEGWIEFKATRGYAVTLRPEQVAWIMTRRRMGGRVFVAVRRQCAGGPRVGPPTDELWLWSGGAARELKLGGLLRASEVVPEHLLGRWHHGPARWDWRAVRQCLTYGAVSSS